MPEDLPEAWEEPVAIMAAQTLLGARTGVKGVRSVNDPHTTALSVVWLFCKPPALPEVVDSAKPSVVCTVESIVSCR